MWGDDGKVLAIHVDTTEPNRTVLLPVAPSGGMPSLPPNGLDLDPTNQLATMRGVETILDKLIIPAPTSTQHAWMSQSVHRNLYRIPLR
jgi:hypothetical protein